MSSLDNILGCELAVKCKEISTGDIFAKLKKELINKNECCGNIMVLYTDGEELFVIDEKEYISKFEEG